MNWNIKLVAFAALVSCSWGRPTSEADGDSEAYYNYNRQNQRHHGQHRYGHHGHHKNHGTYETPRNHNRHIGRYGYKPVNTPHPIHDNELATQRRAKPLPNLPISNLRHVKPFVNLPGVSQIKKPKISHIRPLKPKPTNGQISRPVNIEPFVNLENTVIEPRPDVTFVPDVNLQNILTSPRLDNLVIAPVPTPSPTPIAPLPVVSSPIPTAPSVPSPEPITPSAPFSFPARISLEGLNIPEVPITPTEPEFIQQIEPEVIQPPPPSFDTTSDVIVPNTPFLPEPVPAVPQQSDPPQNQFNDIFPNENSVSFLQPVPAVPGLSDTSDQNDSKTLSLNPNDFNDENDGEGSFLQPVPAVPGLPVTDF